MDTFYDAVADQVFHVRKLVLIPILLGMGALLLVFFLSTQWLAVRFERHYIEHHVETVNSVFASKIIEESDTLHHFLFLIAGNENMIQAFRAGERGRLFEESRALLTALQNKGITHFYFHTLDHHVFLRLHQPEFFGDFIERLTLVKAAESGNFVAGLEAGKSGTVTLRGVIPWEIAGKRIGYLELGKELSKITENLVVNEELKSYFMIDSAKLQGITRLHDLERYGLYADHESFPGFFHVSNRKDPLYPPGLVAYMRSGRFISDDSLQTIDHSDPEAQFLYFSIPLRDLRDQVVGRIILSHQQLQFNRFLSHHTFMVFVFALFTAAALGFYLNRLLAVVERRIEGEVAQRTAVDASLRQSEMLLHHTLEAIGDGILVVGKEQRVIHLNSPFIKWWEMPVDLVQQRQATPVFQHIAHKMQDAELFLDHVESSAALRENTFHTCVMEDGRVCERHSFSLLCGQEVCGRVWRFVDVTDRHRAERVELNALASRNAISALLETGMSPLSLEQQLQVALNIILTVPWLSILHKGAMFLMNQAGNELVMVASEGLHPALLTACARLPLGHCLCGRAAQSRQIVFSMGLEARHEVTYDGIRDHGHYCIPIMHHDHLMGVMNFYIEAGHASSPEEEAFLTTMGQTVAGLIELRRAQSSLHQEKELVASVLRTVPGLVVVLDRNGGILMFNNSSQALTGYGEEEVWGRTIWDIFLKVEDQERGMTSFKELMETRVSTFLEIPWVTRRGEVCLLAWHYDVVLDAKGEVQVVIGAGVDITMQRQTEQLLQHMAMHDVLTGLPNRRLFQDHLHKAISLAQRMGQRLAVLFIDLDRFKLVNDTLGHEAGDVLLKELSLRLKALIRQSDTLARMGGDEFALVLPAIGEVEYTVGVAHKIIENVNHPFLIQGQTCSVGASIGIALFPDHAQDAEALIRLADAIMYRVKSEGRNGCLVYEAPGSQA